MCDDICNRQTLGSPDLVAGVMIMNKLQASSCLNLRWSFICLIQDLSLSVNEAQDDG